MGFGPTQLTTGQRMDASPRAIPPERVKGTQHLLKHRRDRIQRLQASIELDRQEQMQPI